MATYTATLKYSKVWGVEIEAGSLEEAQAKAQAEAHSEDSMTDSEAGECVVLVAVREWVSEQ